MAMALREWWAARRLHWHLAGIAVAAAAFALLGPFGTWDLYALPIRFAYWGFAIGVNWIFALTVIPAAVTACVRQGISEWAGLAAGCLFAALPGTGAIAFLNVLAGEPVTGPAALGTLFLQVLLVHALLGSLAYTLIERPILMRNRTGIEHGLGADHSPSSEAGFRLEPTGGSDLLDALPPHLGRELVRLRMKDHYVEAHTELGHALILMRFRDALQNVRNMDGMQVHRSHWVARRAVAEVRQTQGKIELRLRGGESVPVSRSYIPALRAAGWLAAGSYDETDSNTAGS